MNAAQRRTEIAIGVLLAVIAVTAIVITQMAAERPLTTHDLQQQLSDLESFATEVSLMLGQYAQGKLDFSYIKYQAVQINKNIDDFYAQIESKTVDEDQKGSVLGIETLLFQFSLQLKFIESSQGDAVKLAQIQQTVDQLRQQIAESEQPNA